MLPLGWLLASIVYRARGLCYQVANVNIRIMQDQIDLLYR